ncbi:unnamed protein product [Mycena citricolor]|uniref:F-box domain-containing protein n=1 Tax=Mycena citricolor TaxID=2018698 RepID=A0AAD2HPB9_9AGAR|nr:unnamed protein product [Mycena citricolor]
MSSRLCSVPPEILEHIAYQLACSTFLGPPASLIPLLLTCKTVHKRLSQNSVLFARIFRFKFDSAAVRRRAFIPNPKQCHDQLVLYCSQLQKLRCQPREDEWDDVLFFTYLMMLENDGRNAAQLQHAGLDSYLDIFVRSRMWNDRGGAHGWPTENVASACALWLVWMTTTREKLQSESPSRRLQIIRLVLPYVLVPFRYASTLAPQHHFDLPLRTNPRNRLHSIVTAHGPYPKYLDPNRMWSQVHFSSRPSMIPPLATVAAKLIYFSRREVVPFGIPPHLPLTRAHAIAAGNTNIGPNQDDIREFNDHLNERMPEQDSTLWDSDWWRLRRCLSAWQAPDGQYGEGYVPGTLTGLWQGRMVVPGEDHLAGLITTVEYPLGFDETAVGTTTVPLYMRIAEHHSYAPHSPAPLGHSENDEARDDGMRNAFFPQDTRFISEAGGVTVRVDDDSYWYADASDPQAHEADTCVGCQERERRLKMHRERASTEAYHELLARISPNAVHKQPPSPSHSESSSQKVDPPDHDPDRVKPCTGIQDIIFTGATDMRHGEAWNPFKFHGRLRPWDGMIGILRTSPDPRMGTLFFYGYLVGRHKFVGNWRSAMQDPDAPAYEGAFIMTRREDE